MELGKRFQILLEFFALEKGLNTCLQLVRNGLYLLKLRGIAFRICAHKHSSRFFFLGAERASLCGLFAISFRSA